MSTIRDIIAFLNPGQIPVVAADQPLYALAKQIQWQWPEYGEDEFVIMLGGLHIEMAALRSAGTILRDSGWTSTLSEAGVASSGTVPQNRFWWPLALPEQGKHIKLQHAAYTN